MVAFVLALIGLYAVTGHTVERWTRELGLRIALGAGAVEISWLVLRRVLTQLDIGLGARSGGRAWRSIDCSTVQSIRRRDRVRMNDPGALALIVLSIVVVAVVACLVPIRRAARVDPLVALAGRSRLNMRRFLRRCISLFTRAAPMTISRARCRRISRCSRTTTDSVV